MNKVIQRICLLLVYIFPLQNGLFITQANNFKYTNYNNNNGLSSNSVSCILQDSYGLLWVGTYYGLNKFDGYGFEQYYQNSASNGSASALSNNHITSIIEDDDKNIWVGTKMGLNVYKRKLEKFITYLVQPDNPNSITNNYIYTLFNDGNGNVWVGTMGGGIHLYQSSEDNFVSYPISSNSNDLSNHVSAITKINTGELCVGTYGNGLMIFNPRNGEYKKYAYPGMEVNKLLEDNQGDIWIATNNKGLFRFNTQSKAYEKIDHFDDYNNPSNIILGLSEEEDHIIVASDGGGIQIIPKRGKRDYRRQSKFDFLKELNVPATFCVYNNDQINYWIGTIGNGLYCFNTNQNHFTNYSARYGSPHSISHNNVISVFNDSKNRIWVGTDGGGLNQFFLNDKSFKTYRKSERDFPRLKSDIVRRITEDEKGNLWIGTYDGGLTIMHPETKKSKHYRLKSEDASDAGNQHVWAFARGKDNEMWVGSLGAGLFLYTSEQDDLVPLKHMNRNLSEQLEKYILSLYADNSKRLWIGTSNGIAVLEPNQIDYKIYLVDALNNSGVGNSAITDICAYNDTTLLLGTNGAGFWKFNTTTFNGELITSEMGLLHDKVFEIFLDKNKEIWITTLKGICKFDISLNQFYSYDEYDGLMESAIQCGCSLSNGQIILGGTNGINVFNPKDLNFDMPTPSLLLSKLIVNNQTIAPGDETGILKTAINHTDAITLNYPLNSFSIEYVGISNYFPSKNSYAYMLEGHYNNWSIPSSQRRADFSNLPVGKYNLKIRTANNKGIWSEKTKTISVVIAGPWWKSTWAFLFYFAVIIGLVAAYIYFSIHWYDLRRRVVFETMEREKISHLNELRLKFFTNISHEFRTPLSLINGPVEVLLKDKDITNRQLASLKVIERNSNLLNRLINQLLDFRKSETGSMVLNIGPVKILPFFNEIMMGFEALAKPQNIKVHINNQLPDDTLLLDEDILEKVLYNLISNAVKFTPAKGNITITAELENNYLKIKVADTGIGIPDKDIPYVFERYKQFHQSVNHAQPGTGIGLALTKNLIELHGGSIEIASTEGEGTTILFQFPVEVASCNSSHEDTDNVILNQSHATRTAEAEGKAPKLKMLHQHSVLIVDDNNDILDLLESAMEGVFIITRARDGKEALDLLKECNIDVIVSDIMMPVMDGISLCNNVKTNIHTSHIPVILLTAKTSINDTLKGLMSDADAYIPKPFSIDLLVANCQMLIRNRAKLRQQHLYLNPSNEQPTDNLDALFVKKLIAVVKANMNNESATVEAISYELGMSRSNLHRKIKAITGKSITEFSRSIRLAEGAQLLLQDQMQVSEIAYEVGFNSVSYFIRSFKEEYQLTPSQYKSAHLKWN